MTNVIADALQEAVPLVVKQVEEAEQRERERQKQVEVEDRSQAREQVEARQQARRAAKEELRSIIKAENDAFALEAFFSELCRRAAALDGDECANLETRIQTARELAGGHDAVDRIVHWKLPAADEAWDQDSINDEAGGGVDHDVVDAND